MNDQYLNSFLRVASYKAALFIYLLRFLSACQDQTTSQPEDLITSASEIKYIELDTSGEVSNRVLVEKGRTYAFSFTAPHPGSFFIRPGAFESSCSRNHISLTIGFHSKSQEFSQLRSYHVGDVIELAESQGMKLLISQIKGDCQVTEVNFAAHFIKYNLEHTNLTRYKKTPTNNKLIKPGSPPKETSKPKDTCSQKNSVSIELIAREYEGDSCDKKYIWTSDDTCQDIVYELDDKLPLLKIKTATKQLSWLMFASEEKRDQAVEKLRSKKKLSLSINDSVTPRCSLGPDTLQHDSDWIIFENNPKDVCGFSQYKDPANVSDWLHVTYRYDEHGYYCQLQVLQQQTQITPDHKLKLYNRRTRHYVSEQLSALEKNGVLIFQVNDPQVLHHFLSEQRHLELVFTDKDCNETVVFPYGNYFSSFTTEGVFEDLSWPNRHRTELRHDDLPAMRD